MDLKNKKIPSILLFLMITLFIYIYSSKENYNHLLEAKFHIENGMEIPLSYYEVDIFYMNFEYPNALLINVLMFGVGLYLFFYSSDSEIKRKIKGISRLTNKYLKIKGKTRAIQKTNFKSNRLLYRTLTVAALIWTFYISITTGYYIFFFLVLAYFYYQELKVESTKAIIFKSIFYPLVPFLFIVIFGATNSVNDSTYEPSTGYYLVKEFGKALLPLIICTVITFTTLKRKRDKYIGSVNFRISRLFSIIILVIVIVSSAALYSHIKIRDIDLSEYKSGNNEYQNLIGLSVEDSLVKEHFDKYSKEPEIDVLDEIPYYSFEKGAIAYKTSKDDEITAIFIYPDFEGKLPENLTFLDSRNKVNEKLGTPDEIDSSSEVWYDFNLMVSYEKEDVGYSQIDFLMFF